MDQALFLQSRHISGLDFARCLHRPTLMQVYLSHGTPEGEAAFSAARARIGTRLSDLAEQTSKQIINLGYVVCDRSLRTHYRAPIAETNPTMPFSEAALT